LKLSFSYSPAKKIFLEVSFNLEVKHEGNKKKIKNLQLIIEAKQMKKKCHHQSTKS